MLSRRLISLVAVMAAGAFSGLAPATPIGPTLLGPAPALAAGGGSGGSAVTSSTPAVPNSTNPFSPGVPISPATVPSTTTPAPIVPTTSSSTGSSGLGGSGLIVVVVVAVLVITGIAVFIWRDARRRAPVRHAPGEVAGLPGGITRSGSKPPPKSRKLSPAERRRRKRGRARR